MVDITFANPLWLYLLILIIPIIVFYIFRQMNASASVQLSSLKGFQGVTNNLKTYLRHLLFIFRILAITLLIIVMARPQSTNRWENVSTEGIDIILSLDISSSMLAEDFKPNRISAAKDVAIEFVSGRPDDRMGLVVFSGESFTQCPLTTDHAVLINLFKDIKSGMIEDGTAIGLGLANAITRLKDSKAKSKVIILLTDGVNNQGEIDPITAAEIAKTFGIRVYTVGVGTMGTAPYPVQTPFGVKYQDMEVKIDEEGLAQIAQMTDGKYFRATNNKKLAEIYTEIDQLEKSKIEVKEYSKKQEEYFLFALAAALFILLEVLLRNTYLRTVP
jgi:Ca-activated chloride channel homolog